MPIPQSIIEEIHGRLYDQETGEPTGLNQAFDELLRELEEFAPIAQRTEQHVSNL